jgi:hypothetical protein
MRRLFYLPGILLALCYGPAVAQINIIFDQGCFIVPDPGDTTQIQVTLRMEVNNESLVHAEFVVVSDADLIFDTAVITDTNYANATLSILPDSLKFIWNTPDSFNIGDTADLLDITIKKGSGQVDSLIVIQGYFEDVHGLPVPMYYACGHYYPVPTILKQPADRSVCAGQEAEFDILADGYGLTLEYQWQASENSGLNWQDLNNNNPYTGCYDDTLEINPVAISLNGYFYHCMVDNGYCAEIISDSALLTVNSNILMHPVNQTVHEHDTAVFSVTSGSSNPQYLWEVSTDLGATWSSTQLFPAITTHMLTIVNVPLVWDSLRLRCRVQGDCPEEISETAILHVVPEIHVNTMYPQAGKLIPNPMDTYTEFTPGFEKEYSTVLIDITGRKVSETGPAKGAMILSRKMLKSGTYYLGVIIAESGKIYWLPLIVTDIY